MGDEEQRVGFVERDPDLIELARVVGFEALAGDEQLVERQAAGGDLLDGRKE